MSGTTYCPESLVGTVRLQPVSGLLTVTLTFGITAPEGSVTVPTIVAFCAYDAAGIRHNNRKKNGRHFRFLNLNTPPATPHNFETANCIFSPPCQIGTLRENHGLNVR